ncbi:MAG: class I SAM-dependent methyltransferase [Neptuniibacter sp.]
MKLLVFPADCESDFESFELVKRVGGEVVGASSVLHSSFLGEETVYLPYITDSSFLDSLEALLIQENISHIYTSHAGVWALISSNIQGEGRAFPVNLSSDFPFDVTWNRFQVAQKWARNVSGRMSVNEKNSSLSEAHLSGLFSQYHQIPGQSDAAKLEALVNLAPRVPSGDWVEIGSLYGRSSFALGWLANHFLGSPLICIDPWDSLRVKPQQNKAAVLDSQIKSIDSEKIFQIFKSAIALQPNITYLKALSEEGVERYLDSDFDGKRLDVSHQIAFLHIDGNHHFDEVTKDIALWEPYVCKGGWLAIDDYLWAFGDGPKKAGDNLLRTGRFDEAFVSGDTLYMRKAY